MLTDSDHIERSIDSHAVSTKAACKLVIEKEEDTFKIAGQGRTVTFLGYLLYAN